jgi:hypothetical protein
VVEVERCPDCGWDAGYRYCLNHFHDQDNPMVKELKDVLRRLGNIPFS